MADSGSIGGESGENASLLSGSPKPGPAPRGGGRPREPAGCSEAGERDPEISGQRRPRAPGVGSGATGGRSEARPAWVPSGLSDCGVSSCVSCIKYFLLVVFTFGLATDWTSTEDCDWHLAGLRRNLALLVALCWTEYGLNVCRKRGVNKTGIVRLSALYALFCCTMLHGAPLHLQ